MKNAIYQYAGLTDECLLLRDCGPWEHHPTITNAAEQVVKEVAPTLGNRRLEYIDSEGVRSQLLVKDGEFAGFADAVTP